MVPSRLNMECLVRAPHRNVGKGPGNPGQGDKQPSQYLPTVSPEAPRAKMESVTPDPDATFVHHDSRNREMLPGDSTKPPSFNPVDSRLAHDARLDGLSNARNGPSEVTDPIP